MKLNSRAMKINHGADHSAFRENGRTFHQAEATSFWRVNGINMVIVCLFVSLGFATAIQIASMAPMKMSHCIIVLNLSRAAKTCSRAKMDGASIRLVD